MDDDQIADAIEVESLIRVACEAIAILSDKEPQEVQPDEHGQVRLSGDSAGIVVEADTDPLCLLFRTYLLENVEESPALYKLLNSINHDIEIGQVYFSSEKKRIMYYYFYPTEKPTTDSLCHILVSMLETADLYDDRLKIRLGGERFFETADDEIEI